MGSLFISHSSADNADALAFSARLRTIGFDALFLDFDPEQGIPTGRDWEQELRAQLGRADAMVFLASPDSVASRWRAVEVALARSMGKPVFPIAIRDSPRLPIFADTPWIGRTSDADAAIERLMTALRVAGERERCSAVVKARLERVTTEQDLVLVLEEAALDEARELTRTLDDSLNDVTARWLLGILHSYRFHGLPEGHGRADRQTAVDMFTPSFVYRWPNLPDLPEEYLPELADRAVSSARELVRSGDRESLSRAISLWHRILSVASADHPHRAWFRTDLGIALYSWFGLAGDAEVLDAAVSQYQEALRIAPADFPDRAVTLSNLGVALHDRFGLAGDAEDLDAAIKAGQQAVQVIPADSPQRPMMLAALGNSLRDRFGLAGDAGDLDAGIACLREAVQAAPADHPDRAMLAVTLGDALRERFEHGGGEQDLDASIACLREAVQADHSHSAELLIGLAAMLRTRFERADTVADLEAAIEAGEHALLAAPADSAARVSILTFLGVMLQARSVRTGAVADLDTAIGYLREVVAATPADEPAHAGRLSELGLALYARFGRTGEEGDLDAAIEAEQRAVEVSSAGGSYTVMILTSLGSALHARFRRAGDAGDLDAAVAYLREAVRGVSADDHGRVATLSNLGNALHVRFRRAGDARDLDAAVAYLREAVQAAPASHPDRFVGLSNLASALRSRSERSGDAGDLDAAVAYLREAVQAAPADHHERALYHANLGQALLARFGLSGDAGDLDAAIAAGREAVQVTPADHPERVLHLTILGGALRVRFTRSEAEEDRDAAVAAFAEAASGNMAGASERIAAGRAAASLVARTDPGAAANFLEAAVLLLPRIAPRFLKRGDQQHAVGNFAGLAADAAALALSDTGPAVPEGQRPARALRLLEAARGVLLSQALSIRGDLSELSESHPELAKQFIRLRDQLDRPSVPSDIGLPGDRTADATQSMIRERRQADEELARLLASIRALEGFGAFALPPPVERLEAQAEQGPVAICNVSAYRSDAILITGDGITSLRLPGLDQEIVAARVSAFYQSLENIMAGLDLVDAEKTLREVLAWTWENAAGPVLDALGCHNPPAAGEPWPRVWWVPGGLLSLLPIHAAGYHDSPPDPDQRSVMDRVISSYTPTVGALAHARATRAAAARGAAARSLLVAMPTTPDLDLPDHGRLMFVPAEAELVQARLPHCTVLSEAPAVGDSPADLVPTKANVLACLRESDFAHFACHGYADPADPSQSQLLLHDHRDDSFTVTALAPLALQYAQLAYLSACSTARATDIRLLDETIHLASAFQLAGFPHVIGTLWELNDEIAFEIARDFYAALTGPDGTLNPHQAANALHQATRTQRDRNPGRPYLWGSHIHTGA
jgi:tetratricopeptide (TPR) repeat protein